MFYNLFNQLLVFLYEDDKGMTVDESGQEPAAPMVD